MNMIVYVFVEMSWPIRLVCIQDGSLNQPKFYKFITETMRYLIRIKFLTCSTDIEIMLNEFNKKFFKSSVSDWKRKHMYAGVKNTLGLTTSSFQGGQQQIYIKKVTKKLIKTCIKKNPTVQFLRFIFYIDLGT